MTALLKWKQNKWNLGLKNFSLKEKKYYSKKIVHKRMENNDGDIILKINFYAVNFQCFI